MDTVQLCSQSGHRETAFRKPDNLKIGDQLIVQTSAGTFTYEVNGNRIVQADDKTVIVPTDHAVLCPYDDHLLSI
ncbi:MAG: sortase [Clostridiaceae bacterium]